MNWYRSGDQGEHSKDSKYMKAECEKDFDKLQPPLNQDTDLKNEVCKGPYWNNSSYTKKLKLKLYIFVFLL